MKKPSIYAPMRAEPNPTADHIIRREMANASLGAYDHMLKGSDHTDALYEQMAANLKGWGFG